MVTTHKMVKIKKLAPSVCYCDSYNTGNSTEQETKVCRKQNVNEEEVVACALLWVSVEMCIIL
jgi:hypothetical protein